MLWGVFGVCVLGRGPGFSGPAQWYGVLGSGNCSTDVGSGHRRAGDRWQVFLGVRVRVYRTQMVLQIIGAGIARTGTLSLKQALDKLGFGTCFHGFMLFTHPELIDLAYATAKGDERNWGGVYGEEIASAVDFPANMFYKQLSAANPNAKVILTVRDADSWYESMYETIFAHIQQDDPFPALGARSDPLLWMIFTHFFKDRFQDKQFAIRLYHEHNERVKNLFPRDKLLVFNVKDGWDPLCDFLRVKVPDCPFPKTNSRNAIKGKFEQLKHSIPSDVIER